MSANHEICGCMATYATPPNEYAMSLNYGLPRGRTGVVSRPSRPTILNDPDWRNQNLSTRVATNQVATIRWNIWDDINNEWVALRQAPNHPPTRLAVTVDAMRVQTCENWALEHFVYFPMRT